MRSTYHTLLFVVAHLAYTCIHGNEVSFVLSEGTLPNILIQYPVSILLSVE